MLLYLFILGTVCLSYCRGRQGQDFWTSFWIEAGFLVAILHYGFFNHAYQEHVTYRVFLLGWVIPVIVACVGADALGRAVARWRQPQP